MATSRLVRERLRKVVALAVFSSDAISSTAYGTEQIMLVLVAAGAVATRLAFPVALAIGALLTILILSYRQTITAYPSAGGAYVVSKDNFGPRRALVAGSALLIDYVLTVAVERDQRGGRPDDRAAVAAAARRAAVAGRDRAHHVGQPARGAGGGPHLRGADLPVRRLLRGHAAGRPGAPAAGHLDPVPAGATAPLPPATASVGVLLILHAFAAGCTALTGVEAISNGVPAFRPPEARNARRTLVAMGTILGSLFVGVSFLAVRVGVRPYEGGNPTLIGQLARWVLGASVAGHAFFYLFQAATLAILVLAANTSFADFPRLASFAAADAFLPRRFTKRGQRLVFSDGVLALSVAAVAVILAFRADYNRMLPLYAIGVFTSFTFSQAGMTRRHLRLREPGWRYGIVVNGTGALVTFLVLLDIIGTKFAAGAWMVPAGPAGARPAAGPHQPGLCQANGGSSRSRRQSSSRRPSLATRCLVFVDGLDRAVLHALQYARQLNPLSVTALHVAADPGAADAADQAVGRGAPGGPAGGGPLPEPRPGGLRHRGRRQACPARHRGDRAPAPPRRPGTVRAAAARPDQAGTCSPR